MLASETCKTISRSARLSYLCCIFIFFSRYYATRLPAPVLRSTNLVEVLEQVHYATLDFILSEAGGGRVKSNGLGSNAGRELSWANSRRAADADGSRRRPDGPRNGGSQGADNGGTEHIGRWKGGTRSAGGLELTGSCKKTRRERRAREGMAEEHWEEEAEGRSKAALEMLLPQKPCRQSAPR